MLYFLPICLPIFHYTFFSRGTKWKSCRKWALSLNPAVLSSFLWVLVHALNLQSPAKGPLGLLPKKYLSSFLFLPSFTLKLVSETMWKEVGDKVAGPLFYWLFICCVKDWEITLFLCSKAGIWSSVSSGEKHLLKRRRRITDTCIRGETLRLEPICC